jgi:NTE family protein
MVTAETQAVGAGDRRRVAIVAAGAGARGAYEAGALSVLLPWLEARDERPTAYVGTSAGAINATVLAAYADAPAAEAGAALLAIWRALRIGDLVRAPGRSVPGAALAYGKQVLGLTDDGLASLFDSSPMVDYAAAIFDRLGPRLRRNVGAGLVEALAVVATDQDGRTRVFCDLPPGMDVPDDDLHRAIDYRAAAINHTHVLASAAIPVLFLPISIGTEWFVDGGTRLNVPLAPAIALGATSLAVVATHPKTYPVSSPPPSLLPRPDAVDAVAELLGSVLADRMVEDLMTLDKFNRVADDVAPAPGGPQRIDRVFVGPATRSELGDLATASYRERDHPLRRVLTDQLGLAHRLLGPREPRGGEILSYLFFDPAFIEPAIALGRRDALQVVGESDPWR